MTDTKYVPCPKCGTEIDERVVIHYLPECYAAQSASQPAPAAAALRVAGPDDAIVPLHALRVARLLAASYVSGYAQGYGAEDHAALAAIDAAIARANSEPSIVGSARSAPTQVGFVQFRMRDLERLVAMYLDAAANVPRGDDGRDEEAIDNARAAIAAATPPEQHHDA